MKAKCLNYGNVSKLQFTLKGAQFFGEYIQLLLMNGHSVFYCTFICLCVSYCTSPDMNKVLTDIILDSCVSVSLMPDKLLMEHIMLLAILASRIGMEVGEAMDNAVIVNIEGGKGKTSFHKNYEVLNPTKGLVSIILWKVW